MKKRFALAILILFGALSFAQSLSDQGVLPLSSPVYAWLDAVYLERGMARPDLARPWTTGQARRLLSRLDTANLSPAGEKAVEAITQELTPRPWKAEEDFSFSFEPSLSPELYGHLPLGGDAGATPENYAWRHGYEARSGLLSLPFEMAFQESFWLFSDVSLKEERDTVQSSLLANGSFPEGVTGNWSNLVFDDPYPRPDLYAPFRALFSTGGSAWNFRLGRDRLNWGNGHSGNLLLSDSSDFYDFAMLGFSSKDFSFTSVYASMDGWLADGTRENYHGFMGHRLEFRIADRFMVAVSESVALGGVTEGEDPDIVRDSNFLMIFHDWMIPKRSNSLLSLDVSANPWKYMNVYAQIAMDEFATQYEEERGGGGGPPIFGFLGGVDAFVPLGQGYLEADLECALTSPWLYNRRAAPYYTNVRRYWSLTTDRFELVNKPIGYLYGPDSFVINAEASYGLPGGPKGGGDILWLLQGEKTLTTEWDPAPGDLAPSGVAESTFAVHLFLDWPLFPWLSAGTDGYFAFIHDRDHIEGQWRSDMELAASVTLKLP